VLGSATTALTAQVVEEGDMVLVAVVGAQVVVAARAVADVAIAFGTATTTAQTTTAHISTLTSAPTHRTTVLGGSTTEDEEVGMAAAMVLENGTEDFVMVIFNGTTNSGSPHKDSHSSRHKSLRCRTNSSRSRCRTSSSCSRLLKSFRPLWAQWLRHQHHSLGRGCSNSKRQVLSNNR
jgi:hypothetical protein